MTIPRMRTEHQIAGLTVAEWAGDGPAVVGLAGLGSSGRAFGPLARSLPDRHVVGPHLRGRGRTVSDGAPTGLRAHARDVARVLGDLDLTDVVVVGHSMGAYLAPLVAQEAAGRVARLVLVDGGVPPQLPFYMGPRLTRLAFSSRLKKLERDWTSVDALADKHLEPMLRDRPDLRPQMIEIHGADFEGAPGRLRPLLDRAHAAADAADCFFGPEITAALQALAVPAHLVTATAGTRDGAKPFLADSVVQEWTARLPLLTSERVQGNHTTVLFSGEVVAAVRG